MNLLNKVGKMAEKQVKTVKKKAAKKSVKKSTRKSAAFKGKAEISVVLPVYNEEENIILQYDKLKASLENMGRPYEMIFVDDGSRDRSVELLEELAEKDTTVKLVAFRRNFGQTAAMHAGIDFAEGDIIVFMDSDLQNESDDIELLVQKIDEGYDVASGWRKRRKDKFLSRKLPSMIANKIIASVTKVPLHDLGCSLKAFRGDILRKVKLYGEMHRFIPVHASWIGAKIVEVPVRHHARQFGKSKYGIIRTFKVLLDLITVKFMGSFSTKPIYLYGGLGIFCLMLSAASALATILMKIFLHMDITGNPFFLLFFTFFLLSAILALMGVQSEILIRVYHESTHRAPYFVKTLKNVNNPDILEKRANQLV
jgi:glycosyltransferase involved in cell wall biosynthesis